MASVKAVMVLWISILENVGKKRTENQYLVRLEKKNREPVSSRRKNHSLTKTWPESVYTSQNPHTA